MKQVDILLSTFNGEKYIDELIESVVRQTYSNIRLLVRDDGSKDHTMEKVCSWRDRYPNKITWITDDKGNLGVTRSMFALLKESTAPYVIFCDQDDVWFPDKVAKLVKGIRIKEKEYPGASIVVHCEAYTVDSNLELVDTDCQKALHSYQTGRNKMQTSFALLLLVNPVQGASMILNDTLKKKLLRIADAPIEKSVIYDSIVTSVCSMDGKIFFLNRPLMYYRQHARNVVGASKTSLLKMSSYNEKQRTETRIANCLEVNRKKCELLKKYYKEDMSDKQADVLEHFMKRPNDWVEFMKLGLYKEFSWKQIFVMMVWGVR